MKHAVLAAVAVFGVFAMLPSEAGAVVCARGVYRAGCAGPNGAVTTVRRPPAAVVVRPAARTTVVRRY